MAKNSNFVGFNFLEGVRRQMCIDIECLMHILKCKYYAFSAFGFKVPHTNPTTPHISQTSPHTNPYEMMVGILVRGGLVLQFIDHTKSNARY